MPFLLGTLLRSLVQKLLRYPDMYNFRYCCILRLLFQLCIIILNYHCIFSSAFDKLPHCDYCDYTPRYIILPYTIYKCSIFNSCNWADVVLLITKLKDVKNIHRKRCIINTFRVSGSCRKHPSFNHKWWLGINYIKMINKTKPYIIILRILFLENVSTKQI